MDATMTLKAAQERFLTHHKARNHSLRQIEHYARTFLDLDRFLDATKHPTTIHALTTQTIEAFAVWLRETPIKPYRGTTQRSESGIHGHVKDMKAFIRWCADPDQGLVTWPVKVSPPKVPQTLFRIFAEEELVALFDSRHLKGASEYAVRNRALVALLLDTGIRVAEAAALTPRSLVGGQYVHVMGKGHKERLVPFASAALARLEQWLVLRQRLNVTDDDSLWLLSSHGIKQLMKRITHDTGIHLHAHKLRHQAATMLVRENADLHVVKRMLGHAQLSTVEVYLSLSNADLAAKHALASPFARLDAALRNGEGQPRRRRLVS